MKNTRQAFTLVELIVVITIISILSTIGFISLLGYSESAKDTNQIHSLHTISSAVGRYLISQNNIPPPDNATRFVSSGALMLMQGSFGEKVRSKMRLPADIRDQIMDDDFGFSVTKDHQKYIVFSKNLGRYNQFISSGNNLGVFYTQSGSFINQDSASEMDFIDESLQLQVAKKNFKLTQVSGLNFEKQNPYYSCKNIGKLFYSSNQEHTIYPGGIPIKILCRPCKNVSSNEQEDGEICSTYQILDGVRDIDFSTMRENGTMPIVSHPDGRIGLQNEEGYNYSNAQHLSHEPIRGIDNPRYGFTWSLPTNGSYYSTRIILGFSDDPEISNPYPYYQMSPIFIYLQGAFIYYHDINGDAQSISVGPLIDGDLFEIELKGKNFNIYKNQNKIVSLVDRIDDEQKDLYPIIQFWLGYSRAGGVYTANELEFKIEDNGSYVGENETFENSDQLEQHYPDITCKSQITNFCF